MVFYFKFGFFMLKRKNRVTHFLFFLGGGVGIGFQNETQIAKRDTDQVHWD